MTNPTPSFPAYTVRSASYRVPGSKPGTTYTVTLDPRDGAIVDCTCPDRQYRHRACKHMKLAGQADHGGLKLHLRVAVHTRETAAAESPAFAVASPARQRVTMAQVNELYA